MRISDLSSDVCSSDLATGGDVTLGTDDSGVISVESGAAIDVGAHRPGDRLVRMERNGETFYSFVAGDKGGTLNLRAPVIEQPGADSVNVGFAGVVNGARQIVIDGFKRFDLAAIAADQALTSVTIR